MMRLLAFLFSCCVTLAAMAWPEVYTIYPVPQRQTAVDGRGRMSATVNVVAEAGIDDATVARAVGVLQEHGLQVTRSERPLRGQSNVLLGIRASRGAVDKQAVRLKLPAAVFARPKYDRHVVSFTADKEGLAQVLIWGEHTDAVFCGLASLEQMLDAGSQEMPCVCIEDYADVRDRGVIEGYYGVPYSADVTKDLFRFMARYKMNTYMYGAKSDPYHSQKWAEPYPTTITAEQLRIGYLSQEMLRDIAETGQAMKVNFIWAIHPGTAFTDANNQEVMDQIMHKFSDMHALGVRQFGVFVDDVGVPSDDATLQLGATRLTELQQRMDSRWNGPKAAPADTVRPLHYVPQLYAFSWASAEQGKRFFNALGSVPEKVRIYITGRNVWSVPNNADLAVVREWLGRDASWWWNYPCNDNDVTKLFTMDTYANFSDEKHIITLDRLQGSLQGTSTLISNPMQQGEASKIALFSIADYAWNNAAFDNHRSWEAALSAVVGTTYAAALRKLAPYLRYFDGDALAYLVGNYRRSVAEGRPQPWALVNELRRVVAACQTMNGMATSSRQSDRLFYGDIRPWLLKLEAMAAECAERLEGKEPTTVADLDNTPDFQFEILSGLGADITLSVQTAEPAAVYLQPLLMELREDAKKKVETE